MLGFHCCMGFSLVVVHRLLIVVASLVMEHGLWGVWVLVVVVCGFSSCGMWTQSLWLLHSRAQAEQQWHMGLGAPWHVESSQIRDQTCISCTGQWIPYF